MQGDSKKQSRKRRRNDGLTRATAKLRLYEVENGEIKELERKIPQLVPPKGALRRAGTELPKTYKELPLSRYTLQGLDKGNFKELTKIQQVSILHALAGRDILASAKTGSGKTLAFLIPILEKMYRMHWSPEQGVGVVIISPTRELALQIFEVLTVVGSKHRYSAGLLIGGGDYKKEQDLARMINILVCTPGRFLQHLEQTPYFNTDNVHTLILDEADRLLDMGFKKQLIDIIDYLPRERQTLLYSATQTKSVKDLATLSLSSPEYIAVHEKEQFATPSGLLQVYSKVELNEKLDMIYSFIRNHLKSRIIVFVSTCKQVQFIDTAFRILQPGIPLMCLHGRIKQKRRMHIYYEFIEKTAAVLFATDIVARGLDFPGVDWVVQLDCPEDVQTYIHRSGRTARYKEKGKSLLFLLPNEADTFIPLLKESNIPIVEKSGKILMNVIENHLLSQVNPARMKSIRKRLQAELAKDSNLKECGQKAFKSYVRSIHLQPNKDVFDAYKLPMAEFARSLGLSATPRVKFLGEGGDKSRKELRRKKNMPKGLARLLDTTEDDKMNDVSQVLTIRNKKEKKSKFERLMKRKINEIAEEEDEDKRMTDDDDGGLVLQKQMKPISDIDEDSEDPMERKKPGRVRIRRNGIIRGRVRGSRIVFDDELNAEMAPFEKFAAKFKEDESYEERNSYLEKIKEHLQREDKVDQEAERERVREKHRMERIKLRKRRQREEKSLTTTNLSGADLKEEESDELSDGPDMSNEMKRNRGWINGEDLEAKALELIQKS